jgi:hypothetical protein
MAVKQFYAQFGFEFGDGAADGRLGHIHRGSRAGKASQPETARKYRKCCRFIDRNYLFE